MSENETAIITINSNFLYRDLLAVTLPLNKWTLFSIILLFLVPLSPILWFLYSGPCVPYSIILLIIRKSLIFSTWLLIGVFASLLIFGSILNIIYDFIKGGVFGAHTYKITSDTITEISVVNNATYMLSKALSVSKSINGILIRPNYFGVIFIHKRDFKNQQDFEDAFNVTHAYWKEARKKRKAQK